METFWRVEDMLGRGCYRNQPTKCILNRHDNQKTHPTPLQDININRTQKPLEISGFLSEHQAKNWFNDLELQTLKYMGFELKKIKVEKITSFSGYQALAIR